MVFTCVKRATFLGYEIIGRQHPIYQKKQVVIDNGCFPQGSHAAYVRLQTVDCEELRKALVGSSKKNKFSKLIDGLVQNQGRHNLVPKTLGLCDPSSNPESMALLTQPEKVCKEAAAMGTSMPPEMESEAWREYKRMNPDAVGERFEPLTEKFFVSLAIYAPAPLHCGQN